jgi:hypothetical protein
LGHPATPQVGVALINVSQFFFSADHGNRVRFAVIFDPGSWANKLVTEWYFFPGQTAKHWKENYTGA